MNKITVYSDYFGKIFELSSEEVETIIDIYLEVSEERGFDSKIEGTSDLVLNTDLFDHMAYYVTEFGCKYSDYINIAHVFIK